MSTAWIATIFGIILGSTLSDGLPWFCDFESGPVQFCGMVNVPDAPSVPELDRLGWYLNTGETPSTHARTGPQGDYSHGGQGAYAFMEASVPFTESSTAQLSTGTQLVDGLGTDRCITFWYNAHGYHIGNLTLHTIGNNGFADSDPVWQMVGTPDNDGETDWKYGYADMDRSSVGFMFRGTRRGKPFGDLALDSIGVWGQDCDSYMSSLSTIGPSRPDEVTETGVTLFTCAFALDITCGLNFGSQWFLHTGQTKSENTGPDSDHTSGDGYYTYFEASDVSPGQSFPMEFPTLPHSTVGSCLTFYYSMYGNAIGSLRIIDIESQTEYWRYDGSRSDARWYLGQVTLPSNVVRLAFGAIKNSNSALDPAGDIGLDDISLVSGTCDGGPLPTFPTIPSASTTVTNQVSSTPSPGVGETLYGCDFESSCSATYGNDWIVNSGRSPSNNTGPDADHTTGQGSYALYEASDVEPRSESTLSIYPRPSTQSSCITFYYSIYGSVVGGLRFRSIPDNVIIWQTEGSESDNQWIFGEATLASFTTEINIIGFKAGQSSLQPQGDLAIDDIVITEGPCSGVERTTDSTTSSTTAQQASTTAQQPTTTASTATTQPGRTTPERSGEVIIDCDFDLANTCGFDLGSLVALNKGPTSTDQTGPQSDHTSGNGWYAYFEASNVEPGVSSFLTSSQFEISAESCLHFWYSMFGSAVGSLRVDYEDTNGISQSLWSAIGSQSDDHWRFAEISVPATATKVIFILSKGGNSGHEPWGDIGLDDILLLESLCQVGDLTSSRRTQPTTSPEVSTSTMSTPRGSGDVIINCYFDSSDTCGFSLSSNMKLRSGSTPTSNTGPNGDHTTGNGWYVHLEASDVEPGVISYMRTFQFELSSESCLRFWYNMYGVAVGSFDVSYENADGNTQTVWSTEGPENDNGWYFAEVPVPSSAVLIIFVTTKGGSSIFDPWGDIAFDDILLVESTCQDSNPSTTKSILSTTLISSSSPTEPSTTSSTSTTTTPPTTPTSTTAPTTTTSATTTSTTSATTTSTTTPSTTTSATSTTTPTPTPSTTTSTTASTTTPTTSTEPTTTSATTSPSTTTTSTSTTSTTASTTSSVITPDPGSKEGEGSATSCEGSFYVPRGCTPGTCQYEAEWTFDTATNIIRFTVNARSPDTHWAGIGFAPDRKMENVDIILGRAANAQGVLSDRFQYTETSESVADTRNNLLGVVRHSEGYIRMVATRFNQSPDTEMDNSFGAECYYFLFMYGGGIYDSETANYDESTYTKLMSDQLICIRACTVETSAITASEIITPEISTPVTSTLLTSSSTATPPTSTSTSIATTTTSTTTSTTSPTTTSTTTITPSTTTSTTTATPSTTTSTTTAIPSTTTSTTSATTTTSSTSGSSTTTRPMITSTSENPDINPGTNPNPIWSCDFEIDTCGMINDTTRNFTFWRWRGPTPSRKTGPKNDHTKETEEGHYIYAEASAVAPGSMAAMLSPRTLPATGTLCVTFWYNLHGQHTGSLRVSSISAQSSISTRWVAQGGKQYYQVTDWFQAKADLSLDSIGFIFETVKTANIGQPYGDIGLDDIYLYNAQCSEISIASDGVTQPTPMTQPTTVGPGNECPAASSPCQEGNQGWNCQHRCEHLSQTSFICRCIAGYVLDGPFLCKDINECLEDPCPLGETCLNAIGGYVCANPNVLPAL